MKPRSSVSAIILASSFTFVMVGQSQASTWNNATSGGVWSDNTATGWNGTGVPNATTAIADFNTLDLSGDNTVHLDGSYQVNSALFGDTNTATAGGWTLDNNGIAGNVLTLSGTTPSITVNALGSGKTAKISAVVAGTAGFTKLGSGTLVLSNSNTYTGNTIVSEGILRADRGVGVTTAGNLSVNGGVLEVSQGFTATHGTGNGQVQVVTSATKSSGFSANGTSAVTVTLNGTISLTTAGARLILNAASANQNITLGGTANITSNIRSYIGVYANTANLTKGLATSGSNVVFGKTGSGNLVIQGGWTVTGTSFPTIYDGTLTIDNSAFSLPNTTNIVIGRNDATWGTTGGTFVVKGSSATVTAKALYLGFDSTVTGTAHLDGGVTTVFQVYKGGTSGATTLYLNGGTLKALGTTNAADFVSSTLGNVYVKSGGAIVDDGGFTNITINNALKADAISVGGGFTKMGTGSVILAKANTYTGETTVSAGTLALGASGSISNSTTISLTAAGATLDVSAASFTLGGTQTLKGIGSVTGTVITGASTSTITPGMSPGTLTLSALNAAAGGTFDFELGTTSDMLQITGLLTGSTNAGDLNFNFSDAGGIAANTPYTLFTFGSVTGLDYADFDALTLPSGMTLDSGFGTGGWLINSGNLQVQFVPEPDVAALLGGLGALALLRRRR